jgi:glyceraldehyde 3-phosphate dehydrogenase
MIDDSAFEVVGINDIYEFKDMLHLLKYDSIYKEFKKEVTLIDDKLIIDKKEIKLYNHKNPSDLKLDGVDVVLQCSGIFLTKEANQPYIDNGAKKVIISAPAHKDIPTYIMDINHKEYKGESIISNSSCSANAIVPIMNIIDKALCVRSGSFSMYHSYTAYQSLLDVKHYSKDIRRSRSATQNIQPLISSAQKEVEKFFPHLKDKLTAKSIRVPIKATTLYDFTLSVKNKTTKDELNQLLTTSIVDLPLLSTAKKDMVSSDFIQNPNAAVIDRDLTQVIDKDLIKIFAWQDNEWGYAVQLVRMTKEIG